jgi:hypothetical protein
MTMPDDTNSASPQSPPLESAPLESAPPESPAPPPPPQTPPQTQPPWNDPFSATGQNTVWGRIVKWIRETIDGFVEFFGMIFSGLSVYAGGSRQVIFAIGLACLAAGIGVAIEARENTGGPFWMFVGAFLIGLVIPVGKRKT